MGFQPESYVVCMKIVFFQPEGIVICNLIEQKFRISIAKSKNICNFAARILFFRQWKQIISFSSVRITLKGDDVRLGFFVANIGKISSNEETTNKVIKFRKNKKRWKTNPFLTSKKSKIIFQNGKNTLCVFYAIIDLEILKNAIVIDIFKAWLSFVL